MIGSALFGAGGLVVLAAVTALAVVSLRWLAGGRRCLHQLRGAASALSGVVEHLPPSHPLRVRLDNSPVSDVAFEEIAMVMTGDAQRAAEGLLRLQQHTGWMERFSQAAIHLGILGTVVALISSDPSDLAQFRASLPLALGTTFWGLIGGLVLSWVVGSADEVLSDAQQRVRMGLLGAVTPEVAAEANGESEAPGSEAPESSDRETAE